MKPSEILLDIGKPIAYYPNLRKITGSTNANILLCQLIYWTGRQRNADGWIYKTSDDIELETGLSYKEQRNARKKLVQIGLLDEHYERLEHVLYFKVNLQKLDEMWSVIGGAYDQWADGEMTNGQMANLPLGISLIGNTESTTKNTTESIAPENFSTEDNMKTLDEIGDEAEAIVRMMVANSDKTKQNPSINAINDYPEEVRYIVADFHEKWKIPVPKRSMRAYTKWIRDAKDFRGLVNDSGFTVSEVMMRVYEYVHTPDGSSRVEPGYSKFSVSDIGSILKTTGMIIGQMVSGHESYQQEMITYDADGNPVKWKSDGLWR